MLGKPIDETVAEAAGIAALDDAQPMARNGYMVQIAKVLIKRSILACSQSQ